MSGIGMLALASVAFVGTHFLMSHPLRRPMVSSLGEKGFAGVYSIVSLATFAWMIKAYGPATGEAPQLLWDAGRIGFGFATVLMWLGSVLFVGSLRRNPAFPSPGKPVTQIGEPHGVFGITRHPMMWGLRAVGGNSRHRQSDDGQPGPLRGHCVPRAGRRRGAGRQEAEAAGSCMAGLAFADELHSLWQGIEIGGRLRADRRDGPLAGRDLGAWRAGRTTCRRLGLSRLSRFALMAA